MKTRQMSSIDDNRKIFFFRSSFWCSFGIVKKGFFGPDAFIFFLFTIG